MADPIDDTSAVPRKRKTGRWVWFTIAVIGLLQFGPSLTIIFQRGIAGSFDWPSYIGYQLGSIAVPLAIGCLGLLFRRNRGLGFFVVSLVMFFVAEFGRLAV